MAFIGQHYHIIIIVIIILLLNIIIVIVIVIIIIMILIWREYEGGGEGLILGRFFEFKIFLPASSYHHRHVFVFKHCIHNDFCLRSSSSKSSLPSSSSSSKLSSQVFKWKTSRSTLEEICRQHLDCQSIHYHHDFNDSDMTMMMIMMTLSRWAM